MTTFALLKNPQLYQTVFLMLLLNLGILFFGLYFDYTKFLIVFGCCIAFDAGWKYALTKKLEFPYSGVNAGFGISFFLRTDILSLYVLAAFIAISSKYIFRIQGRHFFNPSNVAVVTLLALFPLVTWTNPLQWGKILGGTPYYYALIGLDILFGLILVWKVLSAKHLNLLYLIVPFVLTHLFFYTFFTNEGFGYSFTKWYTMAFLIFTFHMITDPQTILDNAVSRVFFGTSIAVGVYILQYYINENYAHVYSLFFMTLCIPAIRYFDAYDLRIYNFSLTRGNILSCSILVVLLGTFFVSYFSLGPPDLVFENRCRALFCS